MRPPSIVDQYEPHVRTVLGDVPASSLGHTQPHEHLLVDLGLPADSADEAERSRQWAPIDLSTYYATRRRHTLQDLLLDDEAVADVSMREYRAAGGGTVVDATSLGLGRDHAGLARISTRSGVHVIMGSSFYYRDYHPAWLDDADEDAITASIVEDITTGVGGTDIRAGVIGEVGLSWPHHPVEERVLRASARAQQETGAAMLVHPGRDARSPLAAVEMATKAGADSPRIVMSHVDRTLFERADMHRLADTGCYLEFDLFGQESSYYSLGDIDMPNDATRIDHILDLAERGHVEQVLISQDVCHKTNLRPYGGEGYTHILDHVLPLMRRKGVTEEQIRTMTVASPAHLLALPPSV